MENGMIYKQISQIMRECPAIEKNQRNSQQGYAYRGIDDAMNTLQNLLPKYGVFYVPEVLESHREERTTAKGGNLIYSVLKVRYTFYAEDGSHISAVVQSEGMDSADKSSNKAMSAACKYALFQVFNIPTKEFVDPDATTPEPSKASEKPVMATADYPGDIEVLKTFSLPENFNTYGLNLESARALESASGITYGQMSISELFALLRKMVNRLEKNNLTPEQKTTLMQRVSAINIIFDFEKKVRGL